MYGYILLPAVSEKGFERHGLQCCLFCLYVLKKLHIYSNSIVVELLLLSIYYNSFLSFHFKGLFQTCYGITEKKDNIIQN